MTILLLRADLVEILVKCCSKPLHDLVQVLARNLVEILLKSSSRGQDEVLEVSQ